MTYAEVQAIIDEADSNRDGRLDYKEFCDMLLTTADDCARASKLKASKVLGKKSSIGSRGTRQAGQGRSQTSITGTERRQKAGERAQRTEVYDWRERRREEIRSQLHSSSEGQLTGRRGGEGGRQAFSETALSDHNPMPSSPKLPDPVPVRQVLQDGETGLVNGEPKSLTSLESEPEQDRPSTADPKPKEQPDGPAPSQTLRDPFDITRETPSRPKLPPLTSKGTLPPILPPVAHPTSQEDAGLPAGKREEESFAEEVAEELEEEEEEEKEEDGSLTVQEAQFTTPAASVAESPLSDSHSAGGLNETTAAAANGQLPPKKDPPPGEPRPKEATEEPSASSQEVRREEEEEGTRQTDHLPARESPAGSEEGGGGESMVGPPSSVVPASPKRPANLEVSGLLAVYWCGLL